MTHRPNIDTSHYGELWHDTIELQSIINKLSDFESIMIMCESGARHAKGGTNTSIVMTNDVQNNIP